jgi:serine/threonine protein phosphatase PrpC
MHAECYGATLSEDGRKLTENQDAFGIVRVPVVTAVVCDGAGNAQLAARRVVGLIERWLAEATLGQLLVGDVWLHWSHLADSALLGGAECTLAAISMVGAEARGVVVGDSRVYLLPADGGCQLVSEPVSVHRLGSGEVVPQRVEFHVAPHDMVIIATDGAWSPLGPVRLERVARKASFGHFSDVPPAILEAAGKNGRADDMTAVAIRLVAH